MYKPKKNKWTIEKMIMMGIVTETQIYSRGHVREWDTDRDVIVRAWFDNGNAGFHHETLRYVFEKKDGTFGFATSTYIGDQDNSNPVTFQVLQTMEPPR